MYSETYRGYQRRIEQMKRQLAEHPNGNDPDHPEFGCSDIEEMERILDDIPID